MQTPPPISKSKKNKTGLIILIVISALIILCVVIVLVSTSWAKTPEGIEALTQSAINKTSTSLSITIEPTNTPNPVNAQQSTKNIKPSKTPIPTNTLKPTKTPVPTKTVTPTSTMTPTKSLVDITFQDIIGKSEILTDAQWKEYTEQLNGQRVRWTGYVNDVSDTTFLGKTWYQVDVCITAYPCVQDALFIYPKNESLLLNKGQKITFYGDIDLTGIQDRSMLLFRVIVNFENVIIGK